MKYTAEKDFTILKLGIIIPDIPLQTHIERLSDPGVEVTEQELLNFFVKYYLYFVFWKNEYRLFSEEEINKIFHTIVFAGNKRDGEGQDLVDQRELIVLRTCRNTLRMLWDFACNVEIAKEILAQKVEDLLGNRWFVSLEPWCGTGIWQVLSYCFARRNGLIPTLENNIGIEINPALAQRTHTILTTLDVWKVITGSSREKNTWQEVWVTVCHQFNNENIPSYKMAFDIWMTSIEPFFENLYRFWQLVGDENYKKANFFPSKIFIWGFPQNQTKVIDVTQIEEVIEALEISWESVKVKEGIYPLGIELGGKIIELPYIWWDNPNIPDRTHMFRW